MMAAPLALMMAATLTLTGPAQRSGDTLDRRVRVHNQTGLTITRLDVTASGRRSRAAGLAAPLSGGLLASGQSVAVIIDDGTGACVYDLRVAFSTGEASQRSGVNVCEISDYYFTL